MLSPTFDVRGDPPPTSLFPFSAGGRAHHRANPPFRLLWLWLWLLFLLTFSSFYSPALLHAPARSATPEGALRPENAKEMERAMWVEWNAVSSKDG